MSGNNYNDILENYGETEKDKVSSIIELLASRRPRYEIDRTFQRRLKHTIIKETKKGYTWYFILPRLSLIFTSLLVIVGIWNIWGKLLPYEGIEVPSSKNFASDSSIYGFGESTLLSDMPPQTSMKLSQAEQSPASTTESFSSDVPTNNDTRENDAEKIRREPGTLTQKSILPEARELNIDNEIAAITQDIDTIISDTSIPSPSPNIPEPTLMTMRAIATEPINTPAILIDYPDRMAVYEKSSPWTEEERVKRNASGAVKSIEPTLSQDEMRLTLDTSSEIREMKIEYRSAKKEGIHSFFLIPCLRYTNSRRVFYSPLVAPYTLE